MFKKLLCFSAAFVLILTSFIVPSYAIYYDGFIELSSFDSLPSIGDINEYLYSSGDRQFLIAGTTSNQFVFCAGSSFYFAQLNNIQFDYYYGWSDYIIRSASTSNFNYDSDNNLYYKSSGFTLGSDSINPNLTNYSSINLALAAIRDYIDNPPSTDPIYDDLPNFNIQRGYAAYIDFGSDWSSRSISGTLTSSFPQYSSLISGDWDGTDNRRYFWTNSLPSNTNFTSNVGSAIDWTKVPPYDLLQRSKNGIWFIQSNSPLNRYLVIVNPNQWRYGQNPTDDTINSPITVSDLSGSTGDVRFFALNQKFDTDGTLISAASDNFSNNRIGTYNPDTGQWETTDSNGNAADQVPGGESDTPVISSITDYIHNITSVLTNFANSVISLIQAPISHISELIDAGSGFMSSLRGMYAWLPVDIQGLIIAALTVVIGIGVFKVFL